MDWYSWLSQSGLEPSLVYDYSLLFSHNELEEEDIVYFNHEFLQSMGISIAKHRLEILKLSKKFNRKLPHQSVVRLLSAVNRTKKCLVRYFNTKIVSRDRSAIVIVPKTPPSSSSDGGGRWKGGMLKRNMRVVMLKKDRLLITDGKPGTNPASPMVAVGGKGGGDGGGDGEEIRWDSMFQDLKPT
ncbi:uncharacterized protein A4U43_C08F14650 [Asparagus officinalis]|uniref:uncharacterized protein LOC109822252 n=1 Tax=Asparagus officinalis TaxID=4686 RepID=UPI00098E0E9F|nr:uncharacterized protein LOC109822252 [Asparagus officinalis]ONK60132.1 uncharacterized protein A4U43_C08F14650 [Asparagus officinalis]